MARTYRTVHKLPTPLYYAGPDTGKMTVLAVFKFDDGSRMELAFEAEHISQAPKRRRGAKP